MAYTIYKEFVEELNEPLLEDRLSIIIGKKYSNGSQLDKDLKLLLREEDYLRVVDKLKVFSDGEDIAENDESTESIYPYDPTKADIDIRHEPQLCMNLLSENGIKTSLYLIQIFNGILFGREINKASSLNLLFLTFRYHQCT